MSRIVVILLFLITVTLADQSNGRLKIAILNLKNANGVTQGDAELISDRLRNEFFSTGTVDIMERDQMQAILKEQGFQQSGSTCTDEGCMVEMGKLLGVGRLVTGSVGKLGSMYMINIRIVNVVSGKIERVISEDVKGNIEDLVGILPKIAQYLTSPTLVSQPRPVQVKEDVSKKKSDESPSVTKSVDAGNLPCSDAFFLEKISFTANQVGFPLDQFDFEELNEKMKDAISKSIDKDIVIASKEQIVNSKCPAKVICITLNSYTTKPAKLNQNEGTAKITVSIYPSPASSSPLVSVPFEDTGERHWENVIPLMNTFKELEDDIEDDLGSKVEDFIK
jgi:hypothetical protein